MKIRAPEKPQQLETSDGHSASEDGKGPEAAKEKRTSLPGREAREAFRAVEPCWEGQWRFLKYL